MAKMSLAEARGFLKWSQSDLAREVGTTPSTISDLESGHNKNPGYYLVMRTIKALQRGGLAGVDPEDVFPVIDRPKGRRAVA